MELIDKTKLYNKLTEQEKILINYRLKLFKPRTINEYTQYNARLHELKALKYMIINEPTVEAVPITLLDNIISKAISEYKKVMELYKRGKWKSDGHGHIICTCCENVNVSNWKSKYCPCCGIRMKREDKI